MAEDTTVVVAEDTTVAVVAVDPEVGTEAALSVSSRRMSTLNSKRQ